MARKISFDPPPEGEAANPAPQASPLSARPLLGLDRPIRPASALGAISQSLESVSARAKRADDIEQKLSEGQAVVELDPALIDGSFAPDRMDASDEQNRAFRALIREHGQNTPILVRPHPQEAGRFQVAFGHRRLRAARDLQIKVRAVVRRLSDEELIIAQGQENSARADLTFIERARFAARLEARQFKRETIMAALGVDKAALSRLITVATKIPNDLIDAIGPAPAIGRPRWIAWMESLDQPGALARARELIATDRFATLDSDKRFEALQRSARQKQRPRADIWRASDGAAAARVSASAQTLTLTFDERVAPAFGEFVKQRLQALYDQYKAGTADKL